MFIFLFSYVILCNFYLINENKNYYSTLGLSISIPEVVLIIWVITFLLEEIRKVLFLLSLLLQCLQFIYG